MPETQESIMPPPEIKEKNLVKKAVGLTAEFLFPLAYYLPENGPKLFGPPPHRQKKSESDT